MSAFFGLRRAAHGAVSAMALLALTSGAAAQAIADDPRQGDGRVSSFYRWSEAVPQAPGRMLRSEPLPQELHLAEAGRQLRILYTSTDGVGGKAVLPVSGAIFLPKGPAPKGGWPVVAWAHGTVGMADICAPSWAGRSYRDVRYLNQWLARGYAVVATDYQGLGTPGPHPYLNTRPEAYSVLDAVRAALGAGLGLGKAVVVVGQSQGAGAAVATAAFAHAYAPDVKLLGVVATGVPNLSPAGLAATPAGDPDKADPTLAYLFYIGLMAGQTRPDFDPARLFTPAALPILDQARTSCVLSLESDVALAKLTRRAALQPEAIPAALVPLLPALIYPTLKLGVPLFVGTGTRDEDVAPESQVALVKAICATGGTVVAKSYPEDHSGTLTQSFPDASRFVADLFAGHAIASTCEATKS